jgi:uncharacterized protein YjbI with pentapeptide repeats
MFGITLRNFDLRKASFADKNVSHMSISGILYDKNIPNVDLFNNSLIAGLNGRNEMPSGISKEQFYRTKNYRSKSLVGIKMGIHESDFVDLDFSNFDLSCANLYYSGAYSKMNVINLTDAIIKGSAIEISDRNGITKEQLYSTKSYKQRNLTNITFTGELLQNVNLSHQNLSNCKFQLCNMSGVDLTDSIITGAQFGNYRKLIDDDKKFILVEEKSSLYKIHLKADQIKSTWNYKNNRMDGIKLPEEIQKILNAEKQTATNETSK